MSEYANKLRQQLDEEEGVRSAVYQDHKGYWTIGRGRCVDSRVAGAGLKPHEIEYLFENDVRDVELELARHLPGFISLNDPRRAALVNMAFQMGVQGLLGFKRMLACIRDERWAEAETHALDSKWARVDTPKRAKRMARQIATGEWQ